MGSTTYPTDKGDFDARTDIVEYRIEVNDKIFWKGSSQCEFRRQLKPALDQYATFMENKFRTTGGCCVDDNVRLTRYFGSEIPQAERWNDSQLTVCFDSYMIGFWQTDDIGFNSEVTIKASRGQKGKHAVSLNCFESKHMTFEQTARKTLEFLNSKKF